MSLVQEEGQVDCDCLHCPLIQDVWLLWHWAQSLSPEQEDGHLDGLQALLIQAVKPAGQRLQSASSAQLPGQLLGWLAQAPLIQKKRLASQGSHSLFLVQESGHFAWVLTPHTPLLQKFLLSLHSVQSLSLTQELGHLSAGLGPHLPSRVQ